jgi:hypothetical protein
MLYGLTLGDYARALAIRALVTLDIILAAYVSVGSAPLWRY